MDRRNKRCGDCASCSQSVLDCNGKYTPFRAHKININIQTFKPYFDVTLGREVTSKKEITEFCKRNDYVYAGDKELTQQCEQNKKRNEEKFYSDFRKGLEEKIERTLN